MRPLGSRRALSLLSLLILPSAVNTQHGEETYRIGYGGTFPHAVTSPMIASKIYRTVEVVYRMNSPSGARGDRKTPVRARHLNNFDLT